VIINLEMSESNTLGKRILSGSFWIAGLEISNQLLQFIKTFYAANLLSPADFGIIGFAFLIVSLLEILSTTGMKEAVIQRKGDTTPYLDTVWTIELCKGITVLVVCFTLAPFMVQLINSTNRQLTEDIIKFIGAIYFLQCTTSIGVLYFEKDIQFKRFFIYQFAGTFTDVVVSIVLVYYLKNIWGLLYGVLAGFSVRVIFSFVLTDFRPKLRIHWDRAKELLQYGKWIFGGRIFNFVGLQSDSLIISGFFNLYYLGIYQMGFRIGNLPMSQVSNIIGRLAFPTFSKLQHDYVKLKHYFLTAINVLAIALIPVVVLVFSLIREFTVLFLGTKWIEIVPIVQVLIIGGFLRIFVSLIDSVFCAVGQPKFSSYIQSFRFFVFILAAAPLGYFFGIFGIALATLVSLSLVLAYFLKKASAELRIYFSDIVVNMVYPVLFGITSGIFLYVLKTMIYENNMVSFFLVIVCFVVYFLATGFVLNRYTSFKIFERAFSIVRSYSLKS
jgi:lipopolysaccharide exporter